MNVHKVYQNIAKEYSRGRVLKTDVWNEVRMDLPVEADVYLELDPGLVAEAVALGYPAMRGDIRALPFDDGEFDTVIDFSTIDHIEEYEVALAEYARVLADDGRLILAVWLGERPPGVMTDYDGLQYYFPENNFVDALLRHFDLTKRKRLNSGSHYPALVMYGGVRK